jgi:hypothetical protein
MKKEEQNMNNAETPKLGISDVSSRTLRKNRGMVVFNREFLTDNPTEDFFKVVFSNFFPVAIQDDHVFGEYSRIKMYGYSQHFREIEEGEAAPEYEIFVMRDGDRLKFDKMVERS